jgi:hypothetical protein
MQPRMIVLSPNPAYKLREQWVRLWRRQRSAAIWVAANVAAFFAVSFVIPAALLLIGGLLAAQEETWYYLIAGGLLTGTSLPLGRRIWRWGHDMMLRVAGGMVEQNVPHPDEKPPRVTRMEGRALRELLDPLAEARQRARHARETTDAQTLRIAAEGWRTTTQPIPGRISFRHVQERVDVVTSVLLAGANATRPDDVVMFAKIALIVIDDVEAAFRRALRREPMMQSGVMWPQVFESMRRQDAESNGGEPVSFRTWLVEHRRAHPE